MKILINGKIYTEDTRKPWAEAVAIEGNTFVCVGTNEEVIAHAKFSANEYETVDLGGKTVLPGFIDGHNHPALIDGSSWMVYDTPALSKEELAANVRKMAEKHPKEEMPYFVYNLYYAEVFGEKGPHKSFLDEIISDRPARLNDDSGHGCLYNSMALEMLKDENGIPHSVTPISGQTFFKDENGEYTGVAFQTFQSGDEGIFKALGWKPDLSMTEENSLDVFNVLRHYGDIGVMEAAVSSESDVAVISKLDKEGKLHFYFEITVLLDNCDDLEKTLATARKWQKLYESEHVKIRTVKFFGDGSIEAGDVLSLVPFANDPEGKKCGSCNFEFEEMRDTLVRLNKERLDFHMHCICDGTLRRMLDAVEAAQKICGDDWCIKVTLAHLESVHPDDAKRFKELNVCADLTPHWFGEILPAKLLFLGEERNSQSYDFTQFLQDDICYGFSSDSTTPPEEVRMPLFLGMEIAMTGIEPGIGAAIPLDLGKYSNGRLPESGKFTLEQCIHAATWNNAKRMRILDRVGSIEVGKRACLVVLDKDIFTIPVNEIHTIDPVCTYFDGEEYHFPNPLKA